MFWTERWLLSQWLNQYLLQLVLEKQIRFLCSSKINLQNKTNSCLRDLCMRTNSCAEIQSHGPSLRRDNARLSGRFVPFSSWGRKAASATFREHVFYWSPHTSLSQELVPWQTPHSDLSRPCPHWPPCLWSGQESLCFGISFVQKGLAMQWRC